MNTERQHSDPRRPLGLDHDVIMVGAGLAATLTALRLKALRPELRLCLLDERPEPENQHTWCCFDTDLSPDQRAWMQPLWSNHWNGYQVCFPRLERRLTTGYNRLSARQLNSLRQTHLSGNIHYGYRVETLASDHVTLKDGERLNAPLVLDGRGASASPHMDIGFQKFVGLEIITGEPHGLTIPMVMDAAVEQVDGYRFVYVLPLDETRLLIEDTLYSDAPDLDRDALTHRISHYAAEQGWPMATLGRYETGVLPITLDGQFDAYWQSLSPAVPIGMKALMFHPTTGYSLPYAIRIADFIAAQPQLTTEALRPLIEAQSRKLWDEGDYLRLLNRMMFRAAKPDRRYRILQRFYGLSQGLIERFYAARLTAADKLRILAGKPPVPLLAAIRAMRPSKD